MGISTLNVGQLFQWSGLGKLGLVGGWGIEGHLTEQISVEFEALYVGKGLFARNAQIDQTVRTRLDYVEVPLMLRIYTNKELGGMYIGGGGVLGYLIGGRQVTTLGGQEVFDRKFDLSGNTRRTQFLVALGLGYANDHFGIEVRGENSVTPFDPVIRSQNLTISVQATFRFFSKESDEDVLEEDGME